jgi:hypothetical protein
MTKRTVWTVLFLGTTAAAVIMELVAANDHDPATIPWTQYVVQYVPEPVAMAALGVLVSWLIPHFQSAFAKKRRAMTDLPKVPSPGVDQPKEPLLTVGTVVGVGAAAVTLAVAFGLKLSDTQQSAVLGLLAVLAPFVVAWLARGRVYSPNSVAKLMAAKQAQPPA